MISLAGVTYKRRLDGIYAPDQDDYVPEHSDYSLPSTISSDFGELEAYIESKRDRERQKLGFFYNKIFPDFSSQSSLFTGATYNTVPYTITDQETNDVGTGMSKNYLKTIIDTIVSRLKNLTYEVNIQSEQPLILLELYKKQIERYFRAQIRSNRLEHLTTECFHDAAILGYSHVLMDPWSKKIRKINDYELGVYESEFDKNDLKRVMIKDSRFPVSGLKPYVAGFDPKKLRDVISNRDTVELILYLDCFRHKKFVSIEGAVGPMTDYNFDTVILVSYIWDIGVTRTMTTSLFDLLMPMQRQINKFCAKESILYMNYKGPTPVIASASAEIDVVMKSLSNQAGEICVLSGPVTDVSKMVGNIEATPLSPEMDGIIEALKASMLEMAGTQEISMDLDSLRSAAAVIALDQLRDARFQSQMFAMAEFIEQILVNIIKFNAGIDEEVGDIPWKELVDLIEATYLEIEPVHVNNDPNEKAPPPPPEDYQMYAIDQFIIAVVKKEKDYGDMDYTINRDLMKKTAVNKLLRFKALKGDVDGLEALVIQFFIDDIKAGLVQL